MALVPSGIICGYTGTHASLPSGGWSRKTALDGRYVRSPAASGNADITTDFGNTTHDHGSPGVPSHTHTITLTTYTPPRRNNTSATLITVSTTHSHTAYASVSATITLAAANNEYARIEVIFIESDGTPTGFLSNSVCGFRSDTLPSSWTRINGNGYLKGAAASANGSGTQTGSNDHTHVATGHTHSASNTPAATPSILVDESVTTYLAAYNHVHSVSLTNTVATISTQANEPAFRKLNIIRNDTGGLSFPNKIVAWFNGNHASIPTDWARLTSWDDLFAKGANANGESDVTTGGSASGHTHTQTHTHTATGFTTNPSAGADDTLLARGGARGSEVDHVHVTTVANDSTATNSSSSEAHYPKYRKLILVEWTDPASLASTPLRTLMGCGT